RVDPSRVTSLHITLIPFADIVPYLPKLRTFPRLEKLAFGRVRLARLKQTNRLSALRGIRELDIAEEGNPVTECGLFREYVLFRLGHLPLRKFCGVEVTKAALDRAEGVFFTLRKTVAQIPPYILSRTPDDVLPIGLNGPTPPTPEESTTFTGLESELHHLPTPSRPSSARAGGRRPGGVKGYLKTLIQNATTTHEKLRAFEEVWPQLVTRACEEAVEMVMNGNMEAGGREALVAVLGE
ncbi:Leucine-rich repeat-containing protein 49, partial [Rhizophlyctis rosea]